MLFNFIILFFGFYFLKVFIVLYHDELLYFFFNILYLLYIVYFEYIYSVNIIDIYIYIYVSNYKPIIINHHGIRPQRRDRNLGELCLIAVRWGEGDENSDRLLDVYGQKYGTNVPPF